MKKGISAVVATVLTVLITVAAVTIIWVGILPMIQDGAGGGDQGDVDLQIITDEGYTVWDPVTKLLTVQVERGVEEGELLGINFIFSFEGNSLTVFRDEVPEPGQKKVYYFDSSEFGKPLSVKVVSVFVGGKIGRVSSVKEFADGTVVDNREDLVFIGEGGGFLPITSCTTINSPGRYVLTQNIETTKNCIIINVDDVVLDCMSNSIDGQDNSKKAIQLDGVDNVIIKNCEIFNFETGIYLTSSTNNKIINNVIRDSTGGIGGIELWSNSNNNLIHNNSIIRNSVGISSILGSSDNVITENTFQFNRQGISPGLNSIIFNNAFYSNEYCFTAREEGINLSLNTFSRNREVGRYLNNAFIFNSNLISKTLLSSSVFSTPNQEVTLGNLVNFDITTNYVNRSKCDDCTYNLILSPNEGDFSYSGSGDITGSFTPTRKGVYSLKMEIQDSNGNIETRKYNYFVEPTGIFQSDYYFRGLITSHGYGFNPNGEDAGSLLSESPTAEETRVCGSWLQFAVEEIPEYPVGICKEINYSIWYSSGGYNQNWTGVDKNVEFGDTPADYSVLADSTGYQKVFREFSFDVDWPLDYSWEWYSLGIKLHSRKDADPYGMPTLYSSPTEPSYVNITYVYSTTPAIKQITNKDIDILAATMESDSSTQAQIILNGQGETNMIVEMPQAGSYSVSDTGCSSSFSQNGQELTISVTGINGVCILGITE